MLDLIFEAEGSEPFLGKHETGERKEFFDKIESLIMNLSDVNDESLQYKMLYRFNFLCSSVSQSEGYDDDDCQPILNSIIEFLEEYFNVFKTKPFCPLDMKSFMQQILQLAIDKVRVIEDFQ